MKGLFTSQDSKFSLRTAFLILVVPLLMLGMVFYSLWLLLTMNHSYFISNGFPLSDQSKQDFLDYLLQSQLDYFPYVGLFFIGVFFIGLFIAYVILRPFNQLSEMCHEIKEAHGKRIKIVGLDKQKLLVKLGHFLCEYSDSRRQNRNLQVPEELSRVKAPMMDLVFYFQFICIMLILSAITVTSIYIFTHQLHEDIVQTAVTMLKVPKGATLFMTSQSEVIDLIVLVPSIVSCVLYAMIARATISRIEGVTYAYVRDVCDVVNGNTRRRIKPRQDDPGQDTALAVNEILDLLHPLPVTQSIPEGHGNLAPSGA